MTPMPLSTKDDPTKKHTVKFMNIKGDQLQKLKLTDLVMMGEVGAPKRSLMITSNNAKVTKKVSKA
jgi:hypothetical protein